MSSCGCSWADPQGCTGRSRAELGWSPLSVGFNVGYGLEETSEADIPIIPIVPIIPITILLIRYVSSQPSREALSLRPPRSQSNQHNFQASLMHFSFFDYLKISEAFARYHL